jgi:hypothetical protein
LEPEQEPEPPEPELHQNFYPEPHKNDAAPQHCVALYTTLLAYFSTVCLSAKAFSYITRKFGRWRKKFGRQLVKNTEHSFINTV